MKRAARIGQRNTNPHGRRPALGDGISVGVIGGGIGGLTAALALLGAGFDVDVFEQASVLAEVGAGIQISPNASRVLHALGLAPALEQRAVRPVAWHQRRWDDGRTLLRTPLADTAEAAFGFPYYHLHRADLLSALADAVTRERVHPGHRLIALQSRRDGVEARFANGVRAEFDVVVGADGIHSVVREILFGPERPRFTGCVAYRGLVPADRLTDLALETTSQVWMGPGRHFVHYFVRAGRLVNFVAIFEQATWTRESWADRGNVEDALAAFDGWHPQVRTILHAVDETFIWALLDRAPLPRWTDGRVALLGDSCHAMLPFLAQGAAQAIEDAATLSACLAAGTDIAGELRRYERLRIPRVSRIHAMSAENKRRFHMPDGPEQHERDAEMSAGATDWSHNAIAWIYGHDATTTSQPRNDPATGEGMPSRMVMKRGKTRVWLITGCSSGFGRALADAALARGDCVVATARRLDSIDDLVGDRVLRAPLDVTRQDQIEAATRAAVERFGRIDVLVNNAGYSSVGAVEELEMDDLRLMMETMFFGAVALTQAVLPHMRERGSGTIVQMSSQGGHMSFAGGGAYSAAKFALEGLSEALADEVKPHGIRTLIVEPGAFRTDMMGARFRRSRELEAYAATVGQARAYLERARGTQPGDPRKAARAILTALDAPDPPLRLALGADAVDAIRAKHERLRADLEKWEALSRETGFN